MSRARIAAQQIEAGDVHASASAATEKAADEFDFVTHTGVLFDAVALLAAVMARTREMEGDGSLYTDEAGELCRCLRVTSDLVNNVALSMFNMPRVFSAVTEGGHSL